MCRNAALSMGSCLPSTLQSARNRMTVRVHESVQARLYYRCMQSGMRLARDGASTTVSTWWGRRLLWDPPMVVLQIGMGQNSPAYSQDCWPLMFGIPSLGLLTLAEPILGAVRKNKRTAICRYASSLRTIKPPPLEVQPVLIMKLFRRVLPERCHSPFSQLVDTASSQYREVCEQTVELCIILFTGQHSIPFGLCNTNKLSLFCHD